jgi:hypothetical protein
MFAASKSGKAGPPTDSNFKNVSLLLETSASLTKSTTATDSSASPLTVTRNGSPSSGWTSPYQTDGYWSNYFDGSSYLTISANTAFALSGDFTIEMWVYPKAVTGSEIIGSYSGGTSTNWLLVLDSSLTPNLYQYPIIYGVNGGTGYNTALKVNALNHLVLSRTGSTTYGFVNGVLAMTRTGSAYALSAVGNPIYI